MCAQTYPRCFGSWYCCGSKPGLARFLTHKSSIMYIMRITFVQLSASLHLARCSRPHKVTTYPKRLHPNAAPSPLKPTTNGSAHPKSLQRRRWTGLGVSPSVQSNDHSASPCAMLQTLGRRPLAPQRAQRSVSARIGFGRAGSISCRRGTAPS